MNSAMWDFFDRIYCINISDRQDRRRSALDAFRKIGIADRVEFMIVNRHPHDCERGIYESHLLCMQKGLAAGAQNMVIFEDDVIFKKFRAQTFKDGIEFLKQHPSWNLFFFGCLASKSKSSGFPHVADITYRALTHAYAVNRPLAERLVKKPWHKLPYDVMLRTVTEAVYAIYPSFAFQSNSPSDNKRLYKLDQIRRWCGGLDRIQKVNEWICFNFKLFLALHIIGIGAVAILIVLYLKG